MKLKPKNKLVEHFSKLEDPRIERSKRHKLIDILTVTLLGVICGADSWVGIETAIPNSTLCGHFSVSY
jgi:hypothetical protein